jgi:hypothetical protein
LKRAASVLALCAAGLLSGCSPEAERTRDGGQGGDPQNKRLVNVRAPDPMAADTTLWPGAAATPVERLEKGAMYPPRAPTTGDSASRRKAPSGSEQRAFEGSAADPRRPTPR